MVKRLNVNADNSDIIHLREVLNLRLEKVDLQLKLQEKALELQAKEVERRLELLNNETGRVRAMEVKYVQIELYDANSKRVTEKIEAIEKLVYMGAGILFIINVLIGLLAIFKDNIF